MDVDDDVSETNTNGACATGGHLASLTGFLFGNIDDAGRLVDDDVLDEESRRHLDGLTALGAINSLVSELTDDGTAEGADANDDCTAVLSDTSNLDENRPRTAVDYKLVSIAVLLNKVDTEQSSGCFGRSGGIGGVINLKLSYLKINSIVLL